jgi:hypothetical protein
MIKEKLESKNKHVTKAMPRESIGEKRTKIRERKNRSI